jgi:hypothetical protein
MTTDKKFEFKKLEGGKCAFVMKSADIERTEVVSEEFAKTHYKELITQKTELMNNLGKANRELETNKVEKDNELEHFIELANNAAKYKKYIDAQQNQKAILDMIESIEHSIASIEKVMPEVKRAKK